VALGNNPCIPYDICVKTFAGLDAGKTLVFYRNCLYDHHLAYYLLYPVDIAFFFFNALQTVFKFHSLRIGLWHMGDWNFIVETPLTAKRRH
jgi:hypothetical protein